LEVHRCVENPGLFDARRAQAQRSDRLYDAGDLPLAHKAPDRIMRHRPDISHDRVTAAAGRGRLAGPRQKTGLLQHRISNFSRSALPHLSLTCRCERVG
jgi:hypothetical protein